MLPKIFLDTNIIIDFLEQREFELAETNKIFQLIQENNFNAFVSETVITNALYITNLDEQLYELLRILNLICIKEHSFKTALTSTFKDKEDAILYYGALAEGVDYFVTRNKKDFIKYSLKQLPVLSPKELISKVIIK